MPIHRINAGEPISPHQLAWLHWALVEKLKECRHLCNDNGMEGIEYLTLIARDPHDPDNYVVVTTDESLSGRQAAARLLLKDDWND